MTIITEQREEDEGENPPPMFESEMISNTSVFIFLWSHLFAYVSGYKNRFQNFIRYLREMGTRPLRFKGVVTKRIQLLVMVVTTHEGVPQEFYGAQLIGSRSFPCPCLEKVPLSLALCPRIISAVAQFKLNIIHASSPGIMVFRALLIAKMFKCTTSDVISHSHTYLDDCLSKVKPLLHDQELRETMCEWRNMIGEQRLVRYVMSSIMLPSGFGGRRGLSS